MKFNKIVEEIFNTVSPHKIEWKDTLSGAETHFSLPNGTKYKFIADLSVRDLRSKLNAAIADEESGFKLPEEYEIAKEIDKELSRKDYQNVYNISFKIELTDYQYIMGHDEFGTTGTGSAASVFSIVVDILRNFVENYKPYIIWFVSKEENRTSLYKAMVKKLATSGWSYLEGYDERPAAHDNFFVLYRD